MHKIHLFRAKHPKWFWGSLLGTGGLLYVKVWLPVTHLPIPCVFHEIAGLHCPGCGITRAAVALLHLDVEQAFRYNSLVFMLLPLFACYYILNKKHMHRSKSGIMAVMLMSAILFGVLRNIPMFEALAPTSIR